MNTKEFVAKLQKVKKDTFVVIQNEAGRISQVESVVVSNFLGREVVVLRYTDYVTPTRRKTK